jgi:branched-chain amino acid transport system permease protein
VKDFFNYLIQGLATGSAYALVAIGFVIIFRASKVLNFAQGAFMMLGAYLTYNFGTTWGLNYWLSAFMAMIVVGFIGFLIEETVIRWMRGRPTFSVIMATLGVTIAIEQIAVSIWGNDNLGLNSAFGINAWRIGGVPITPIDVFTFFFALFVMGSLVVFFRRSRIGNAMRATAVDEEAAIAHGISPRLVFGMSWALAAAIASLAGVLLSSGNGRTFTTSTLVLGALTAVPAVILGGLDSTSGAIVGGFAIGVSQKLMEGYQVKIDEWMIEHFFVNIGRYHIGLRIGESFHVVFPYIIMIAILLIRPYGVFGSKEVRRV